MRIRAAMLFVFGIVVAMFCFLSFLVVWFSDDIIAYLQAKTEELKAQAELLRKEAEANREHSI